MKKDLACSSQYPLIFLSRDEEGQQCAGSTGKYMVVAVVTGELLLT